MKRAGISLLGIVCMLAVPVSGAAQEKDSLEISRDLVPEFQQSRLSRYETGLVPSLRERQAMKEARLAMIREREAILDTLSISERRKSRLLRQLHENPYSRAWDRILSDLRTEDLASLPDPEQ